MIHSENDCQLTSRQILAKALAAQPDGAGFSLAAVQVEDGHYRIPYDIDMSPVLLVFQTLRDSGVDESRLADAPQAAFLHDEVDGVLRTVRPEIELAPAGRADELRVVCHPSQELLDYVAAARALAADKVVFDEKFDFLSNPERHRHSPSVGVSSPSTVADGAPERESRPE